MKTANEKEVGPKPYLEGQVGQLAGSRFVIEGKRAVIGRDATQCEIVLPQSVISKVQAALEMDEWQRVTLLDLSAKQTTFVNGEPITRRELRDGDRVGFGLGGVVAFIFHSAFSGVEHRGVPSAADDRAIARLVISTAPLSEPGEPPRHAPAGNPRLPIPDPGPPKAAGGTMILRAAQIPVIRLGRAPDNNFVLDAPSVSRHHAMLSYQDGEQPVIADLGSTNGTFVNGELLTEPRQLSPEDLIFLGGFLLHMMGAPSSNMT